LATKSPTGGERKLQPRPPGGVDVAQFVESSRRLGGARIALRRNRGGSTTGSTATIMKGLATDGG
jgi:hypothetical protein